MIKLAVLVWFFIRNANRSKYPAIGPNDRDPQVRDHPQFNIRVRLPLFVPYSIRDKQRLPGLHHGLAIKPCIEGRDFVLLVWIPLISLDTKTLMFGGSTLIIKAEGTCMISAVRLTISCHFRIISGGTGVDVACSTPFLPNNH